MSNESSVLQGVEGLNKVDPRTYTALQQLIQDVYAIYAKVFPAVKTSTTPVSTISTTLGTITNFTATPFPNNLRLSWDILSGAFQYEIRIGSTWDTATPILTTSSNVANIDPTVTPHVLTYGSYTFLIRPRDINGLYGQTTSSASITVSQIPAPTLSLSVTANFVAMSWVLPASTWQIAYTTIYKNGSEVGTVNGNFKLQIESSGGTYSYKVISYDIAGNASLESQEFTIAVGNPVDFSQAGIVPAAYTGTYDKTALITYGGIQGIIGAIVNETYEEHFINNGWTTIQDQIDAGYPLYFQPSSLVAGTYVEVFDFSLILFNVNVTVQFDKINLSGSTAVTCQIEVSDDNITYSSPISGLSGFFTSVRYTRVTLTFTNSNDLSAAFVSSLKVNADIQFTTDSDTDNAVSTDAGGTEIFYNVTYRSVNSVTVTAVATANYSAAVVSYTKDSFFIKAWDNATGLRVTTNFSWKARGIV